MGGRGGARGSRGRPRQAAGAPRRTLCGVRWRCGPDDEGPPLPDHGAPTDPARRCPCVLHTAPPPPPNCNCQAIIYVVDSSDVERIGISREEFHAILAEEELKDALLLIYANKQVGAGVGGGAVGGGAWGGAGVLGRGLAPRGGWENGRGADRRRRTSTRLLRPASAVCLQLQDLRLTGNPAAPTAPPTTSRLQDLPGALSEAQVAEALGLHDIRGRDWAIYKTSAIKGEGLFEGLDWLSTHLKK